MSDFRSLGELLIDVLGKCAREAVAQRKRREIRDEGETLAAIERLAEIKQLEQSEASKAEAIERCRKNGFLSTPGKPSAWDTLTDEDCKIWR